MTNMKLHWVSHWAHLKKRSDGKNGLARDAINIRKGLETKNRRIQEATNLKKGLETKIDEGNKGYDLLKKMGYQDGQGLGKDGVGILQPLPLDVKTDRKGLGTPKKMVAPVQKESTKTEQAPKCKVNLVNTGALPKQTIKMEEKSTMLVDPKVSLPSPVWANQKQENPNTQEPMIRARSKHSPIRSPESSPPRGGVTTKPNGQGAIVKIEPRVTDVKVNLQQLIDCNSSEDPNFLKSILERNYSKIELMQLRLEAAAATNTKDGENDLIVAKIRIGKDEPIPSHAFEFIRTELVGWIGVYQEQNMATPIFHSMRNQQKYISIVCENAYAFKCLDQCVDDITQMKTMGLIKLSRSPHISSIIYCFDAIYEGIVRDPEMFLIQIQKHKPKLNAEQWMIISHEVFPQDRRTYFMFLIDERSALALQFQYSSNFCICMQNLLFRNRGIVAEEYLN